MAKMHKLAVCFDLKFGRDPEISNMECSLQDIINEWDIGNLEIKLIHGESIIGFEITKSNIVGGDISWIEDANFIRCIADISFSTDIGSKALREVKADDTCWYINRLNSEVGNVLFVDGDFRKKEFVAVNVD